jgi:hypothetical protein
MKQLRTITLISILILIFIPISNAGYAPNELNYNHKPLACFDCHDGIKVGFGYEYDIGDECSGCHTLYNRGNFKEIHEPLTCKGCHGVYNLESFHTRHTNTSCIICHIDNTLPDNIYSECLSCHISGLHSTHIEKRCEMCHPNTIPQKIIPRVIQKTVQKCDEYDCWDEIIQEINTTNETISINTSKPITNYKRITIYEILLNLYKAIRDDIYG